MTKIILYNTVYSPTCGQSNNEYTGSNKPVSHIRKLFNEVLLSNEREKKLHALSAIKICDLEMEAM